MKEAPLSLYSTFTEKMLYYKKKEEQGAIVFDQVRNSFLKLKLL